MTKAPRSMTPREARDRWLDKRQPDVTEATLSSLYYRLKLFTEWCEREQIELMEDITGWEIDEYEISRRKNAKPITLSKELGTLKQWLEYCETIGLVDESVPEAVSPPTVDRRDQSNDQMLSPDRGEALLRYYRTGPDRASRGHVLLEIAWTIGARVGGIRALDVRDADTDEQLLAFRHREETGTGLKNAFQGQRMVGLLDETAEVIHEYLTNTRMDMHDDQGRQPLLPSQEGRPEPGTIRDWMYMATQPCIRVECPHDKRRESCEWTSYNMAGQCPSSRAPHHVRTGSITWQLSRGVPIETVAKRVNATVDTIKKHYDKEDPRRELEERRRAHLENLTLEDDTHE